MLYSQFYEILHVAMKIGLYHPPPLEGARRIVSEDPLSGFLLIVSTLTVNQLKMLEISQHIAEFYNYNPCKL